MRKLTILICIVLLTSTAYAPLAWADDAVSTMAGIVISLKHYPSASDKSALTAIADGASSDATKAVANAIAGFAHKVAVTDVAKLEMVIGDTSNPEALRTLAEVVLTINHVPGDDAIARLEALTE